MKKIMLTSLYTLLIASSASAMDIRPYASLKLGYASVSATDKAKGSPDVEWDTISGFTGAIAGGAAFAVHDMVTVRGELEYSYTKVEGLPKSNFLNDATFTDHTILLNGFADFGGNNWFGFNPYVGLHLGYAFGTIDFNTGTPANPDFSVNGFVYGASTGVAYSITNNIAVDFGVRYLISSRSYDEVWFTGDKMEGDFNTNQLSVLFGARYTF